MMNDTKKENKKEKRKKYKDYMIIWIGKEVGQLQCYHSLVIVQN